MSDRGDDGDDSAEEIPPLSRQLDILRALPDTIEAAIRSGRSGVPASLSSELDAALGPVRTDVRRLRNELAESFAAMRDSAVQQASTQPVEVDMTRIEDLLGRLTMVLDTHVDSHRRIDAVEEKIDRLTRLVESRLTTQPTGE